ncbi:Hypothetical protein IALB_2019 [Ignavibacterium album JCM 16511]|uniref:Uncharacterized protein n=1 Tax=Ignavibacterium album (strain DSM 19864 / JCM 16511 / NBRC 101810 / Mat9-16) TaxID=945713 RepID=I0AL67_IGNAJ|nr:hypothetical protein [Ignavibacterium album]AFH49724.1 Hypothetical protein IALB_2019 [Ignavibacterium album JCM 16511]
MKDLSLIPIILILLSQISCDYNVTPVSNTSNLYRAQDSLDFLLINDPLVIELLQIRNNFTQRINDRLGKSFSLEELKSAYLRSDEQSIISYMNYTPSQIDSIGERLNEIRIELNNKYPAINSYLTSECVNCNIDSLFTHYYDYTNISTEALECRWGPYIASLIVCTTLGPILYWPCAYVAMCSWCSGGVLNYICQFNHKPIDKSYFYFPKFYVT